MLYLIVNNDFHVDNLLNQYHNFKHSDICVLRIPYNLKNDCHCLSGSVITIAPPYKNIKNFFNPMLALRAKNKIDKIGFNKNDVVIFLTEYDPINQYAVFLAKKNGARTILLEEGIATYYNNISKNCAKFSFKDAVKIIYIKYLLGFNFINFVKQDNFLFLQLKDKYIDYICTYHEVELKRDISNVTINSCSEKLTNLDDTSCIFLNQPIYQLYMNDMEYLELIVNVIEEVETNFESVYFKFHPRDSMHIKSKVKNLLNHCEKVVFTSESLNMIETVKLYRPGFAVSFFSDSLFKLSACGLKMVFLFHLVPQLEKHPLLINLKRVLEAINYKLVNSITRLNLIDDDIQKTKSYKSLSDLLGR